ncbi:GerAB/ArcD/ProY family transporter [Virgibacillus necropolis]|uniref:Spore gernimation protein n=1 Tax=Virgibacillus necropolis TaxID=163877 RepID=A0A221MG78_9BACI|nr:GerAB/ArcD/ProY family transporter [Virgibacillus necropolis]ASN06634.1 spore gernimation protein [Virgibacillus necropolis]
MDVNVKMKGNLQIRAFYLFFIITSIQTGAGIMGAPKFIYLEANRDSWLAILIAFVYMILVVLAICIIVKQYDNADIFGIQIDIFGVWIGKLFGCIFIIHIIVSLFSILITYIEVIQIFIFPTFPTYTLALILLSLVMYSVLGGIRVIVGVTFIFFILIQFLMVLLIVPAMRIDILHFLPAFQSSFVELLKGAKATSYSFIGFEILLLLYPFIQNKKNIKLPVILGLAWTAFTLLLVTVIAIGYYSPNQLGNLDWSVLGLFKIVSFSFLERFDYVVVSAWMMVILPNLLLLMWGSTYGVKRLFNVSQKKTLYIFTGLLVVLCSFFKDSHAITNFVSIIGQVGFWIVFVYPFVLLPLVLIKKKWRKHKGEV